MLQRLSQILSQEIASEYMVYRVTSA